jgi:prepilin peptidase CpaA
VVLLWAGAGTPLPAFELAAAFLLLVVFEDLRHMKIPNLLTGPALLGAVCVSGSNTGLAGVELALLGALLALVIGLVPYAVGWLGAGDVKALMALGALWGPESVLPLCWWMAVFGGGLGLAFLAVRGGLLDLCRRWCATLQLWISTRRWTYLPPAPGSPASRGLPFGVAMAFGAAAFAAWGIPWA